MDLRDPIVNLSIGAEAAILQVHQGVLCRASEFFKTAMKPEWTKQRTEPNTLTLLDDSIEDVSLYVLWLYSREIRVTKADGAFYDLTNTSDLDLVAKILVKGYIYGQKIDHDWIPEPELLCMAYDTTPKRCSLRQLLEDQVVGGIHTDGNTDAYSEEKLQDYPRQLLIGLICEWAGCYQKYGPEEWHQGLEKYLEWLAEL